ncbi:AAA ATPase midasin [Cichlidogyrus casuarinus]|uniref:AAA ATPase midasin n=1 Tax=Cichlidogyrus casuarinus TaxID=1844966 RepID=A0ABD2PPX4_9PLAT
MHELVTQLRERPVPSMDHLGGDSLRHMSLESAKEEWITCQNNSNRLARQLCESLRLVLEPTRAAKMKGDFRTGKRLNLRKIIPYIASNFRKDKIWLRRSQPSQREYKIVIAVDDSSSMADNLCRQMTFEALNMVLTAFSLLEVGQVGICSFGESVKMLHPLDQPWTDALGPDLIRQFTFEQRHTSLVELITVSIKMMQQQSATGNNQQLLLILSDGLFTESPDSPRVKAAVRLARDCNLFPVCIIFDDLRKQHSIFDMKRYSGPGKLQPYMDLFPLPYYMVMRQVTAMPHMLADALRQWFELTSSS